MTTFATVFGALPLAFSSGAGSEARQAIGWVIVGGMSLGTILTLIIIPVFYFMIVNKISGESTQHKFGLVKSKYNQISCLIINSSIRRVYPACILSWSVNSYH